MVEFCAGVDGQNELLVTVNSAIQSIHYTPIYILTTTETICRVGKTTFLGVGTAPAPIFHNSCL